MVRAPASNIACELMIELPLLTTTLPPANRMQPPVSDLESITELPSAIVTVALVKARRSAPAIDIVMELPAPPQPEANEFRIELLWATVTLLSEPTTSAPLSISAVESTIALLWVTVSMLALQNAAPAYRAEDPDNRLPSVTVA
eukprot:4506599-Prymnesium_polylepis.2